MALHFDILTLFPEAFQGVFSVGMMRRARQAGLLTIAIHNIRDYTRDKHHTTDDTPYGGGGGMVMKPEPIFAAVEGVLEMPDLPAEGAPIILLSPQGRPFHHAVARELAGRRRLVLICGRYEGVDERVRQFLATDEISIGDYVLSGGEIAAMAIVEATVRLLPGVLGDPGAPFEDSHAEGLLEYPHYTRPPSYRGHDVPAELLSGNHAQIVRWRRQQSLKRTLERRPELLQNADLSREDREYLDKLLHSSRSSTLP